MCFQYSCTFVPPHENSFNISLRFSAVELGEAARHKCFQYSCTFVPPHENSFYILLRFSAVELGEAARLI